VKVYFYPHSYLRDRHLETIRNWPKNEVQNPEIANNRKGAQVSKSQSGSKKVPWNQKLPLLNIKLRPKETSKNSIVHVWGALIATGKFIVNIDNPWSMTGYNTRALSLYTWVIRRILLSRRCLGIHCISKACRESLRIHIGENVFQKAKVHYPTSGITPVQTYKKTSAKACHFLFIGSQFKIKGGVELLTAYKNAKKENPNVSLTIITHLPKELAQTANDIRDLTVLPPKYERSELFSKFMQNADVLVHPSYMESFGMTILEAMANGLAIIANDVYAISEMVESGQNGYLLEPMISKWNGASPNKYFMQHGSFLNAIDSTDSSDYVKTLTKAMLTVSSDPTLLDKMKSNSLSRFRKMQRHTDEY